MKSVLVPLDGTVEAEKALPPLSELCSKGDTLVLLTVVKPEGPAKTGSAPGRRVRGGFGGLSGGVSGLVTPEVPTYSETTDQVSQRQISEGIDYLKSFVPSFEANGIKVRIEVLTDEHPADAIVKFAKTLQPTFIAMTRRPHTGITGVLTGSVASHVVRADVSPVLLVPSRQ